MELEGHPTHDLVDELQRRGGRVYPGSNVGPDDDHLELVRRGGEREPGLWIFLGREPYETGFDEEPDLP